MSAPEPTTSGQAGLPAVKAAEILYADKNQADVSIIFTNGEHARVVFRGAAHHKLASAFVAQVRP